MKVVWKLGCFLALIMACSGPAVLAEEFLKVEPYIKPAPKKEPRFGFEVGVDQRDQILIGSEKFSAKQLSSVLKVLVELNPNILVIIRGHHDASPITVSKVHKMIVDAGVKKERLWVGVKDQ